MLNNYIKNRGTTQMLLQNNNQKTFNEINWDADYDGNVANISLDSMSNGKSKHYNIQLDNDDLANLLNIPSVNMPIDKRLKMDLERPLFRDEPNIYRIELPNIESLKNQNDYLSSPLPNEELIIPVTINGRSKKYSLTPRKFNKQKKTHKTYKVYKKRKSSSKKSNSKTNYQRL